MKYAVKWTMTGETEIDTAGTDWLPEEVESMVNQALDSGAEKVTDIVAEEFDDCEVTGESGEVEYDLRRLS